ncbi:MAG: hypothetical protein NC037_05545 [Bacteroides sp.]|nr:hypothetical protein [Bacillota bacterium]MCM1393848.1 hypothetical protein [[Eubacterium] siraeum]MCM1455969.1 hypothetical protein [Bacteroides sp.]
MANGKVIKKYAPIIWIGLLIACLVRNAYEIYLAVSVAEPTSALSVFWLIIRYALSYGIVPMAVVFLCAFVVWHISSMRYVRAVPRADFCYLVMAAVAVVKFFVGIIEIFSILNPNVATITTTVLDFTLLTGVLIGLYFLIAKWYNLNPVEKYNVFKVWFMVYMIVAGVSVIFSNSVYLSILDGGAYGIEIWEILYDIGQTLEITELQLGASVAVICIYFAYLIAVIVLGELLRKKSDRFRNPETRGEFYENFDNRGYKLRGDADSVFDGTDPQSDKKKSDDNVFDEFDI